MVFPVAGMIAASAIGAGGSMLGANKASKAAGSAAEQQKQLSQQDLAFRRALFDYERSLTEPARRKMLDLAMSDRPLFYDQTANQIRQNYSKALRGMQGLGYGSGLRSALTQGAALNQASDLGAAYNQGMVGRLGLLQNVAGGDKSLSAGQLYSQGLGNLGQFYGQQAGLYNQAAQQGWQNFGNSLSGLAYGLASMYRPGPGVGSTVTSTYLSPEQTGGAYGMRESFIPPTLSYTQPVQTTPLALTPSAYNSWRS